MARLGIVVIVLTYAALGIVYCFEGLTPPRVYDKDFGQEYLLVRAVHDQVSPYIPMGELAQHFGIRFGLLDKAHPTPHPPTLGVFLQPLAFVDYPVAAAIWLVIELGCLLASVAFLLRSNDSKLKARALLPIALAVAAWPAVLLDLNLGQLMTPMLLLLTGAQLALLRQRPVLGGALLGLSLMIKPIAWPWLLVMAACRSWRGVVASAVVAATGYVVSGAVIGFDVLFDYLRRVLPELTTRFVPEPSNISLWTISARLGLPLGAAIILPSLVVLAFGVWLWRTKPTLNLALGVATCVGILVSPISWQFYLVLVAIPCATVLAARPRGMTLAVAIVVAVLLLVSYEMWRLTTQFSLWLWLGPSLGVGLLAVLLGQLRDTVCNGSPRRTNRSAA